MKMRFGELLAGSCFQRGKRGGVRKKLPDGRVLTISKNGKKRVRALKGDPVIDAVSCPLSFLGAGLGRKAPGSIIEIGSREAQRRRRGC